MTIYVDPLRETGKVWTRSGSHQACHMASDLHNQRGVAELHEMAQRIGMNPKWFQDRPMLPHYDLTPSRRELAISRGAVSIKAVEFIRKCRWTSAEHDNPKD